MFGPETPKHKRKSSNKKILISSPSQEILHFLTLPNPSANENPCQRLQFITPKNKNRSTSHSSEHSKTASTLKKPSGLSRVTFIRKKALNQSWGKNSLEIKTSKLTLNNNYKSKLEISRCSKNNLMESNCIGRLNFTFGSN